MNLYLMIENPGVAPIQGYTLLGASTKRDCKYTAGTFGSGNKMGIGLLLRHKLNPIIFCGNTRLDFFTKKEVMDNGLSNKEFDRVFYTIDKQDETPLGFVLDYGATDWNDVSMSLREFVANALDRVWDNHEHSVRNINEGLSDSELDEILKTEYLNFRGWSSVTCKIVSEKEIQSSEASTRIFIPVNDKVFSFYSNIDKWFLHFSEPELLLASVLPKKDRSLGGRKVATIYKKGVRVREVEHLDFPSLFDYNLESLPLDECRKADDWAVKHYVAKALIKADTTTLKGLFSSFGPLNTFYEHTLDSISLQDYSKKTHGTCIPIAAKMASGDKGIFCCPQTARAVLNKGYRPIILPDCWLSTVRFYGVSTSHEKLSENEREGLIEGDPTEELLAMASIIWKNIEKANYHKKKSIPPIRTMSAGMDGGSITCGKYSDGTVFINTAIIGDTTHCKQTILEEFAHYITGSTDESRDFQDWAFGFASVMMEKTNG